MPNLLKFYSKKNEVELYNFNEYSDEANVAEPETMQETEATESAETLDGELREETLPEALPTEAESEGTSEEQPEQTEEEKQASLTELYREEILQEARIEAERILAQAELEAMAQKTNAQEEGYEQGFHQGYEEGYAKSEEDVKEKMEADCHALLEEIRAIVDEVTAAKEEVLQKYTEDLKNIAIAIGEKVIQVSLKSSGSVIEKMILAATDKLKAREWAKIYISKVDADLLLRGDKDILKTLSKLSDNLKVVVMEDEKPGACIIELPDEIIDASASTQMENIKEILKNTGI